MDTLFEKKHEGNISIVSSSLQSLRQKLRQAPKSHEKTTTHQLYVIKTQAYSVHKLSKPRHHSQFPKDFPFYFRIRVMQKYFMVKRNQKKTRVMTIHMAKCCRSPLNFTSSTSFSLSMMSPLGLNVWQGQCTLISKPKLVPDGNNYRKESSTNSQIFQKMKVKSLNKTGPSFN